MHLVLFRCSGNFRVFIRADRPRSLPEYFRVSPFASAAERMQGERSEHASLGDVSRRDRCLLSSKMRHHVIGERRYFHV